MTETTNFSADMSRASKREMKDGFSNDDICFEVLSRVPTKSLLKSKLVSKKWHQIISEFSFMRVQSQISKPVISGFFFQEKFQWCEDDIESVSYIPVDSEQTIVHNTVLDFLPEKVVLMTSSNGLLCCRSCKTSSHSVVYVCNPTNKQWITLKWDGPDNGKGLALAPIGISANFRLVNLRQMEIDSDDDIDRLFYLSFEIYSSSTGEWKTSGDSCVCQYNLFKNVGIYASGVLYWLTDGDEILMFDVENEVPRLIKKPTPQMVCSGVPESCIGETGGQLYYIQISEVGIQVWILEDHYEPRWVLKNFISLASMEEENPTILYNVERKMASRVTVDMTPWMDPLAFNEGLLFMRVCAKIYLYHLETRNMKELCTLDRLGPNSLTYPIVLPYNISLVPLQCSSTA
ncbi:F-box domain [Macleaya cordata]|uniref:F-box domain n=1 Tax=Macleaya cordata TaxID=56857 RepID=A0A200Q3A9_MACCD|nr:F-box domain [Macleaya cordata]